MVLGSYSPSIIWLSLFYQKLNKPYPYLVPTKAKWHNGQKWINETRKFIGKNTAFWPMLSVQLWRSAVWIGFAFGRLGVTYAQASWLAQVGRGVLIGQSACRLLASAREAIDSTRAGTSGRLHWAATVISPLAVLNPRISSWMWAAPERNWPG